MVAVVPEMLAVVGVAYIYLELEVVIISYILTDQQKQ